jgi:hypothetical protein
MSFRNEREVTDIGAWLLWSFAFIFGIPVMETGNEAVGRRLGSKRCLCHQKSSGEPMNEHKNQNSSNLLPDTL